LVKLNAVISKQKSLEEKLEEKFEELKGLINNHNNNNNIIISKEMDNAFIVVWLK
jgi:hypothetical protein